MEFETEMEKEGEAGFQVQFVMSLICALNIMRSQEYEPFVQKKCSTFLGGFYVHVNFKLACKIFLAGEICLFIFYLVPALTTTPFSHLIQTGLNCSSAL